MTPQQLKNAILQQAIQGKLVEQRAEEGTGQELFEAIQDEKNNLIKEGKLKKQKALPDITEDEIPFEIPETWKWVRLRDICTKIVDGDHNPPAGIKTETNYWMLSAININNGSLVELNRVRYLTKEVFEKANERTKVKPGDIFFTIVATLGRSCVYEGGYNICFQRSVAVITTLIYNYYLKYALDSGFVQQFMVVNATGTAQKGFYLNQVDKLLIPLPPLDEQKRIVEKIEELLPLVERYEKAWARLEELNKKFPLDMQKAILGQAIQGKLVEQRAEEGTGQELFEAIQEEKQKLIEKGKLKKQKALPEITEDEIPFEIPETWKWVKCGDILNIVSAKRVHQSDWQNKGIPFYRAREISKLSKFGTVDNDLFISEELFNSLSVYGLPEKNDLMVSAVGTLGKTYIVKENDIFYYKDASVLCFKNYAQINAMFLKYAMDSSLMKNQIEANSRGTTVGTLTIVRTSNYIIPLPPLDEQKRIVEKIEELLPLVEKLK